MASRVIRNLRGLGLSADRLTVDNLTDQGAGTTDSNYSQAGPRPGQATTTDIRAKLEPQISGGQSAAVEFQVRRAGLPARGELGMVWRLDSDTTVDAWRGRPPPNFANHWVAAVWSDAEEYGHFELITVPSTQTLVCLYVHTGPGVVLEEGHSKTFSFSSKAWGSEVDVTVDPRKISFGKKTWDSVAAVALPNDRIVSYWANGTDVLSWYSDDAGATWAPYALPALDVLATPERMRAVYYRGDVMIITEELDDFRQFASNSLGTKFTLAANENDVGASVSAVAIPGNGGIAIGYSRFADQLPCLRILSSCFDSFGMATEIVIDPTITVEDCTITVDDNGTLWMIGRDTLGSPVVDNVWTWFSLDGGANWTQVKPAASNGFGLFVSHDNSTRIVNYAATFCRGWMILAHNWVASPGNEDGSIGTLWSSGWSSISTSGESLDSMYERRFSMAPTSGSTQIGSIGIPIELPQDTIWVSGGTPPALVSPGELEFATVAGSGFILLSPATAAGGDLSFFYEAKITAGAGSSTSLLAGFELQVANGVKDYHVEVRFDAANSRIRVFDAHAVATVVDISIDVSTFVQVIASIRGANGELKVAYRRPFTTHWIDATPGLELLTNAGAGPVVNFVRFGNIAGPATVTQRVRQWHHAAAEFARGIVGVAGFEFGLINESAIASGGNVNALPVAVPEIGTSTQSAFIAAQRGPGRDESVFEIAPFYDFGVDRIFPQISPSPADPWRSTDLTEQIIAWDFDQPTRVGEVWLLVAALLNANIKTAHIECGTGSVWSTAATYNAATGFEGLIYSRTGDTIRPGGGTGDAARFLNRNELRGGFVIMATGGAPKVRRIARNSAGGWTDPTLRSTMLPEIRLEGVDGTEPITGLIDIVWPAGVVFHTISPELPAVSEYFRYWRLRIPVQDVVDPYYQVGNFLLGSATVFGKQNSRGWSQGMEPNTSRRVSRFGTVRKQRNGPPARRWSMGWADGVYLGALRAAGVNQSYLSPTAGDAAVAALDDVWALLWGLLEETEGGQEAVLALNSIPAADDVTITDRLLWMYGTWDSGVQANQVVGNEGVNEFVRIDPIRISELK